MKFRQLLNEKKIIIPKKGDYVLGKNDPWVGEGQRYVAKIIQRDDGDTSHAIIYNLDKKRWLWTPENPESIHVQIINKYITQIIDEDRLSDSMKRKMDHYEQLFLQYDKEQEIAYKEEERLYNLSDKIMKHTIAPYLATKLKKVLRLKGINVNDERDDSVENKIADEAWKLFKEMVRSGELVNIIMQNYKNVTEKQAKKIISIIKDYESDEGLLSNKVLRLI